MATYVGNSPEDILKTRRRNYYYTATSSQTTFTGADDNGTVLNVNESDLEVFMNGVLLDQSDYTANTTHIVLSTAAATDDILEIQTFNDYFVDSNLSRFGGNISGSIIPTANNTYTLGNTTNRFADLYLSGTTLHLGDQTITSNATHMSMSGAQSVTGTVTANDVTISSSVPILRFTDTDTNETATVQTSNAGHILLDASQGNASGSGGLYVRTQAQTLRALFGSNGDISFYEDTGTTAKLFWDASEEGLGIGTTTVGANALVVDGGASYFKDHVYVAGGLSKMLSSDSGSNPLLFGINAQEKMRITGSGNVGIGTQSPSTALEVDGIIASINSGAGTDQLQLQGYGSTGYINMNGSGHLIFRMGSGYSEKMRIDSSGRVGIGTGSPTVKLELGGETGQYPTSLKIQRSGHASSTRAAMALDNFYVMTDTPGNGTLDFSIYDNNNAGHRLTIAANGNVGIGTTSPGDKLHVQGSIRASDNIGVTQTDGDYLAKLYQSAADGFLELFTGEATPVSRIKLSSYGDAYINPNGGNVGIGTASPSNKLDVSGGITASGTIQSGGNLYLGNGYQITTQTSAGKFYAYAGGTYRGGQIDFLGGLASPDAGTLIFRAGTGGSSTAQPECMRISASGDINIGQSQNYSSKVMIERGSHGNYLYMGGSSEKNRGLMFSSDVGSLGAAFLGAKHTIHAQSSGGEILVKNDSYNWLYLAPGGSVGIGTTSPYTDSKLHVLGTTADTGTSGGSQGLSIATGGGTSCPIYFGSETNSAQKSMYMTGYWIYLRGHQNEGIRFVFSQGAGTAPRSDQYQFKYNSAYRPTGNTTWDGFSDARAKENVINLTNALDLISQLRPVKFDWTDDYADRMNMFEVDQSDPKSYNWTSVKDNGYDLDRKTNQIGFIAQEFEEVFPKSITETEMQLGDTTVKDFKTVNYDHLIPVLTKAIQELKAENDQLKARLDAAGL